jgi:hypothetical protein
VTVQLSLSPPEPTIGDELTLEINVAAEPNVEVLMPEFGEALDRYTILDFVPRQAVAQDGSVVYSQKYTLQPTMSGDQSIPPILVEFVDHRPGKQATPEDFDAFELITERIDFHVKSVLPASASAELKPPLGELELEADSTSAKLGWLTLVLAIFALAGVSLWYVRRVRRGVLRRNAYDVARQRLDNLIQDRQSSSPTLDIEHFFVEISAVIRRYLEDRFDVRAPELTTDEFLVLTAAGRVLSGEHQRLLEEFLVQADLVKFAGVRASENQIQRSCEIALRFLEETRSNAPDITIPALSTAKAGEIGSSV